MLDLDQDELPQSSNDIDWLADCKKVSLANDAKDWHSYRIFGKVFAIATHNVKWISTSAKNPGKENHWTKLCPRLNPLTCQLDAVYPAGHPEAGKLVRCPECERQGGSPVKLRYLMNVIDRPLQELGHANPIAILELPENIMRKQVLDRKKNNKVNGVAYSPAHDQYGFDVIIKFDKQAAGEAMYAFDKGERTPITEKERSYTLYNIGEIYADRGVRAADPDNLRNFLQRVKLLPIAGAGVGGQGMPGTQMPQTPTFLDAAGSIPEWQMPQTPMVQQTQQFVAPTFAQPQQTFAQPSSFNTPAPQPEFVPPPSPTKFAGPPTVEMSAPSVAPTVVQVSLPVANGGHPECFQDPDQMGASTKCVKCPSRNPCFAAM